VARWSPSSVSSEFAARTFSKAPVASSFSTNSSTSAGFLASTIIDTLVTPSLNDGRTEVSMTSGGMVASI
jgi:hypothetical protein